MVSHCDEASLASSVLDNSRASGIFTIVHVHVERTKLMDIISLSL
jgi:hypothetical protein